MARLPTVQSAPRREITAVPTCLSHSAFSHYTRCPQNLLIPSGPDRQPCARVFLLLATFRINADSVPGADGAQHFAHTAVHSSKSMHKRGLDHPNCWILKILEVS